MTKRIIALLIALTMLFSMAACAKTTQEPEAVVEDTTEKEVVTEETVDEGIDTSPYTIDWYVDLPWWSWGGNGWGLDMTSKIIQEKTGVTINFIIPATDGGEQLSGMIASGDLPDVITVDGWWNAQKRSLTNQLAMEDYIWSYNDLIDEYAPSMWDEVRMDMFNWHAEDDGKTYLLQNYSYGVKDLAAGERLIPNGGIIVRKDMWEQIGSPDMSTPEAFLAACEKVKAEIGEYDGQTIVPLQLYEGVGNSALWTSQFFATPYEDADGNWVYDFKQDNYKDSLEFLNDAYNRGLVIDANFSDTRDLVNEKIASGRVFAAIVSPQDFIAPIQSLYDLDNNAVYMPMAVGNYNGEEPVLQDIRGFGWLNTAITKNAENPERIIQLFEYLLSEEGQIDAAYGIEGETFEFVEVEGETKIKMTQEYLDAAASGDTKAYALGSMMMLDNWALRRKWEIPSEDARSLATSEATLKAGLDQYTYDFNASALKVDPNDPDVDAINDIKIKMDELRKRNIAQLIIAESPEAFDALYAETLVELEALGLAQVEEFNNKYFQVAKDALGIERSYATRND